VDCFGFTGDFCLVPAAFPAVKVRCRGVFFLGIWSLSFNQEAIFGANSA
jgi:hypothetical protein